ncbi:MAG: family 20 glycosylhydrolase [Bacteroidetes bacterium]|nr:family 20 glycosylhydrolase [Bacteroidota bacterium]
MRQKFCVFILWIVVNGVYAQLKIPSFPNGLFSTYYLQRVSLFKSLPITKGDIIFLGNSITDGAEWSELFADSRIKNRGISGDITSGVMNRMEEVVAKHPSKIFLLIGTNDLAKNISADSVVKNILWMADYLHQELPSSKLYVQSILPVNDAFQKFEDHTSKGERIKQVNTSLQHNTSLHHYTFVDICTPFSDVEGKLNKKFTNDGLHLTGDGYMLWKHLIYPLVYDLQPKAALIPMPQQLKWRDETFPLYQCNAIVIKDTTLRIVAERLQQALQGQGLTVKIENNSINKPFIELRFEPVEAPHLPAEAYHLVILKEKILLSANTLHGIFNGIQTLLQLMRDYTLIDACEISDWPAFEWRGYMVDVGRNFQSLELLKQQIEVMAAYKLNVFHLHLTEDIAWRLASRQYPQLTAPENMLRHKGQYYSEEELKELITFCKKRFITLIPEIDMPGHSAAFTRAMGTDMQSEEGLSIIKNILKEFLTTYDVAYVHIGADEVKLTNQTFIPEVTSFIEGFGKKVIGWEPGGNFSESTIRQLWMDDKGKTANASVQYIDSRHLYLNHMDPLESVVTIFNRRIGNKPKGDKNLLGGAICLWHDRAVANPEDVLKMNPVYPAMLTFAERSWRGGGTEGWVANAGTPNSDELKIFIEFENRLWDHKQNYFQNRPFPYERQASITWKFFGPYLNEGNLAKKFAPEEFDFSLEKLTAAFEATGGTLVLRHWWHPLIKGLIEIPEENTTWYATTKIWSNEEMVQDFWIGFNNLSRSPATDSPPANAWDNKQSALWVNRKLILPPSWKRAGQKGNSEIPLIDEGYEYRSPSKIQLNKGWNTVVVKLPIAKFKGINWQNPVKWMFTFVPVY